MVRYRAWCRSTAPRSRSARRSRSCPPAKNFIDELVFANLKQMGVPPSPVCDDATFLRRVSLDIAGRLPTVEETRAFIANRQPDKRDRAIETLLSSPDYADYFANKWTALLQEQAGRRQRTSRPISPFTPGCATACWRTSPTTRSCARCWRRPGTIVDNPGRGLVQAGEGAEAAARGRGAALPRRADAMRPVPSPSLRALEPGRLLQLRRVLQPGGAQADGHRAARTSSSTSAASRRRRTRRPSCR